MIWDPELLARVRFLHLRARHLTEAVLYGEHRSRRMGQAVEFAGYSEYQPGMDLRFLDWNVWGRSDRLVVRRFESETELPSTVVLDLSGDMATGSPADGALPDLENSKAGVAITLAATLLYFLHLHGEPIGLEILAGDGELKTSTRPRGGRQQLQRLFIALASARPGGQAGLKTALSRVGNRIRRRSLVMVITDGMEEPEEWLGTLGAFAKRKSDLRLFHLWDSREWSLGFGQPARFYSPEGGESLSVDPVAARTAFAEVAREFVNEVQAGVVRWGGRYLPMRTDQSLVPILRQALCDDEVGKVGVVP